VQNAVRELEEEARIVVSQDQFELRAIMEFCIKHDTSNAAELFNLCHIFTVIHD
jgi:8-oxo-dGTP pyrophosphatase MutT (NUDIX family)